MDSSLTPAQQEELFEAYGATLYEMAHYAVTMGAGTARWTNKAERDEVLAAMWIKLAEKGLSVDVLARKGGRAYLWTMTRNTARDLARRVTDYPVDLSGGTNGNTANVVASMGGRLMRTRADKTAKAPESVVEDIDFDRRLGLMGAHIEGLVRTLSGQQHYVVELFYLEGLDTFEVADKLGIKQPTVKVHLKDARKALGGWEGDLRIWREWAYPDAKTQPGTAQASKALQGLM